MRCPDDERLARAALMRLTEPADPDLATAVALDGAVDVLAAVRAGGGPRAADRWRARLADLDVEADLARGERAGARLVCPGDLEWPSQLTHPGLVPPLGLWLRGPAQLRLAALRSVSVVGARAATPYGEHVAAELSADLASAGWSVVSGAAFGVDAAAHRAALAVGGLTIAVLACGADVSYPRANDTLLARVAESGLVVSELPPGTTPTRSRFLDRNRLIAALTRGTVVVEAAARSGALGTAAHAARCARVVMAVPGPVVSSMSAGCHRLIRDGQAVLVTGAREVLELVASLGELPDGPGSLRDSAAGPATAESDRAAAPDGDGRRTPWDGLSREALRVFEALPVRRGSGPARLAAAAGLDPLSLTRALGELCVEGLAVQDAYGWRLASGVSRTGGSSSGRVT